MLVFYQNWQIRWFLTFQLFKSIVQVVVFGLSSVNFIISVCMMYNDGGSLVGLRNVVAPMNNLAGPVGSSGAHPPKAHTISECLGDTYAKTALAPNLRAVVRDALSSRCLFEVQIDSHLKSLGQMKRYQSAFAILYAMALRDELTVHSAPDLFGGLLLELNSYSPSTACNANSAMLLVARFHSIRLMTPPNEHAIPTHPVSTLKIWPQGEGPLVYHLVKMCMATDERIIREILRLL